MGSMRARTTIHIGGSRYLQAATAAVDNAKQTVSAAAAKVMDAGIKRVEKSLVEAMNKSNPVWQHLKGDLPAKRANFNEVPVIDVAPVIRGMASKPEWEKLITSIRHACFNVGFFYVINHGVPPCLVEATFAQTKRFFDLPLERKMEISCRDTPNRGYFEMFGGMI